ncbi:hypothetical protein [Singulisphaera sp. PoT]|uniref:hypothetical protein n=1 Tax=Singulisphaera sp. PoT TaxID=3411797 RepID=UPI003BF48BFB
MSYPFDRRLWHIGIGLVGSLLLSAFALTSPGCGGGTGDSGVSAAVDPKADDRNSKYNDYMKSKPKGKGLKIKKE